MKKQIIVLVFMGLFTCFLTLFAFSLQQVSSETFALSSNQGKKFMFNPLILHRVYGYSSNGDIIQYKDGYDYKINFFNGTIERTSNSRIPDYSNHIVTYNSDGSFSFCSDPRNPELNIEYQIYVDYITILSPFRSINKKEGIDSTVNKLTEGKPVRILLCGDSISSGAQTSGLYYHNDHYKTTFYGLLIDFINYHYDTKCEAEFLGENGVGLQYMYDNLFQVLEFNPDVVIIEFGMNDHISKDDNNIISFKEMLSSIVSCLKNDGVDVILVGFFQQNDEWELEIVENTFLYNEVIKLVAEKNDIPFIDIYMTWNSIPNKVLNEDMTSDYMHHPTDFGHMVYFSELVPYFLDKNISSINNYIYIG